MVNDDGIDAPGLQTLLECIGEFGNAVTAAPKEHLSGCGHQVTGKVPIEIQELRNSAPHEIKRWAVDGTPVDCIRLALTALCPQNNIHIDWVISGINAGGNLGVDIYTSGTVAASRESAILGVSTFSISHHINGRAIDWILAKKWALSAMKSILEQPTEKGVYWNINLPHVDSTSANLELIHCPVDTNPVHLHFKPTAQGAFINAGVYNQRPRTPGSDVDVCFGGKISVSKLNL